MHTNGSSPDFPQIRILRKLPRTSLRKGVGRAVPSRSLIFAAVLLVAVDAIEGIDCVHAPRRQRRRKDHEDLGVLHGSSRWYENQLVIRS